MNEETRQNYIKYRLQKADETLEVAELLVQNKKWNSAVNRFYYACFYAVSALLVQAEIAPKSHAGIKGQFLLHYIKTNKIDRKFGKLYADLFDWRQKGDYGDFFDFQEKDVLPILPLCQEFMEAIKQEISR